MVVEESQTLIFNLLGDLRQNYWEKKGGKFYLFIYFIIFWRKEKNVIG